ncbi:MULTISPECIES: hypothetical protein [Pseudomonas]|uniref:Uncharacterized protein n=1 Tax=Pseudomonas fluorescens TaxID=294 RepID=A0AAE2DIA1_PSEFL|nr:MULTISPECIES: hypothetical protein [Pseudomonas]KIF57688.1 hypothetical protein QS95_21345 [Pseudomonas fluorescens]
MRNAVLVALCLIPFFVVPEVRAPTTPQLDLALEMPPFISLYEQDPMTSKLTVAKLLGPWSGDAPTGLTQRCREAWDTPIEQLSDLMVATFLNQDIAFEQMLIEAKRRMDADERDDTEYFDGQLLEAMTRVPKP